MSNPSEGYVLCVDKPAGPTSHDIVAQARRGLGERRIGHTGTLDPFATGLLVLCVGPATRLSEYLTGMDKEYEAVARLGVATDSCDLDGNEIARSDGVDECSKASVASALDRFLGRQQQVPPAYSAKKLDGERVYLKARRGEAVELPPQEVEIHDLALLRFDVPDVAFRVRCSSGTYVRALARDLGETLGVGAHLTALRRTAVGPFRVEDALQPEQLAQPDAVEAARIRPLDALGHFDCLEVDDEVAARLGQGQRIRLAHEAPDGQVAVRWGDRLLAVAQVTDGVLSPRKVFKA